MPASRAVVEGRLAGEGRCYPGPQSAARILLLLLILIAASSGFADGPAQTIPAGTFESFDRIGTWYILTISQEQTYRLSAFGEGPITETTGRLTLVGTRMTLDPQVGTLQHLEIIRWGRQLYLAAPGDISAFCTSARAVASRPTKAAYAWGVFLETDEKKPRVHPTELPPACKPLPGI